MLRRHLILPLATVGLVACSFGESDLLDSIWFDHLGTGARPVVWSDLNGCNGAGACDRLRKMRRNQLSAAGAALALALDYGPHPIKHRKETLRQLKSLGFVCAPSDEKTVCDRTTVHYGFSKGPTLFFDDNRAEKVLWRVSIGGLHENSGELEVTVIDIGM